MTRIRDGIARRDALKALAAVSVAASLPRALMAQDRVQLAWWDVFQPLIPLHTEMWKEYAAAHPVDVVYTGMNPADMAQAVQLAVRSNEAPDVMNVNGDAATLASLQAAGWFQPLADNFTFDTPAQKAARAPGFTEFDGKLYSFPIFSPRQSSTSLWYFADRMEAAGFDPDVGAGKWEDVRKAAASMTRDGKYGLLLPLQFTQRMSDHLTDLAQAAGAAGAVDWKTGEYAYASDPFVEALEFLVSFQKDGTLHPASSSLDARQGRARWAAGEAGMFVDGPWNSGVLKNSFAQVIDGIGVGRTPYPGEAASSFTRRGPVMGTFFISSQSKHPQQASDVLQLMTTDDYYVALAERMDQPPLDLSAVQRGKVHPTYAKVIASFAEYVRLAPDPLLRNGAVSKVYAGMKPVLPGLGEIIQGAFSGAFDDPKPVLKQFADQMSAERERAIAAAKADGAEVSLDDWVFADWVPDTDYVAK